MFQVDHKTTTALKKKSPVEQQKESGLDYSEMLYNQNRALAMGSGSVVQKFVKEEEKPKQTKGVSVNENTNLEKEADVFGKKAADGLSVGSSSPMASGSIQQKNNTKNIDSLAKTAYEAIKGLGTDEDAIHNVLNNDSAIIQSVISTYNEKYNNISGKGLVQDIINDTSGRTRELCLYQLKRANIPIPESKIDDNLSVENPGITADKEDVMPQTKVTYTAPEGFKSYKWYVLNDPSTRGTAEKNNSLLESSPPIYEGGSSDQWTDTWDFPGVHTVVCRAETSNGKIQYLEKEVHVGSVADEIPKEHASFELMAHYMAYSDIATLSKQDKTVSLLNKWGYDIDKSQDISGSFGFFALLLMPKDGSSQLPVLAFRGTHDLADVLTDLDTQSPGYYQYNLNRERVGAVINSLGSNVILTGHSLGGALAQYAAADFTSNIQSVVTFQSPAIPSYIADRFNKMDKENRPDVTHHIANNDVVDLAGEKHLDGTFYLHHLKNGINPLDAHTSHLFSSPSFEKHRESMGIDDSFYQDQIQTEMFKDKFFVEKFKKHPNAMKRFFVESIRKLI